MSRLVLRALLLLSAVATPAYASLVTFDASALDSNASCAVNSKGDCTIRSSIEHANAVGGGAALTLDALTYTLTLGRISALASLSITGAGAGSSVIDGGGASIIVQSTSLTTPASASLSDLTMTHFSDAIEADSVQLHRVELASNIDSSGTGRIVGSSDLTVDACNVHDNSAAMILYASNTATVTSSFIVNNVGTGLNAGVLTMSATSVQGNKAQGYGGNIGQNISGGGIVVTSSGSIVGGSITGNSATASGGGVFTTGTLTISGGTQINTNTAAVNGGGIAMLNSNLQTQLLHLQSVAIGGNSAGASGGGLYLESIQLALASSSINNNTAAVHGGGVWLAADGAAASTFDASDLSGNQASQGGALFMNRARAGLHIQGCTFKNDRSTRPVSPTDPTPAGGGAVFTQYGALYIGDSELSGNLAAGLGGAILAAGGAESPVTLERSLVAGNTAGVDGAAVDSSAHATFLITASTVSGNTAPAGGVAVLGDDRNTNATSGTEPRIQLTASTVAFNTGGVGNFKTCDATCSGPGILLDDTILSNNGATDCVGLMTIYGSGPVKLIFDNGHNLEDGAGCGFSDLSSFTNLDPKLLPLADNGGATFTHALAPDSPAIDSGEASIPLLDQRKTPRPVGAANDIGAFEAAATLPAVTGISPATGPAAGGTIVTLNGRGFVSPTVSIGGSSCNSVAVLNAIQLSCVTTAHAAGATDVTVSNAVGAGTLVGGFTYLGPPAPVATNLAPTSGPAVGGTAVVITGTGFTSGASVTIGGGAAIVTALSNTQINATTPAHAAGTSDLVVTNPDGQTSTLPSAFTFLQAPQISAFSPGHGPITGGTAVNISGSFFKPTATVSFGGVSALVTFISATTLSAMAPAHPGGAVTLAVTVDGQTSTAASTYTYDSPPSLGSISPTSGDVAGGALVSVSGAGFQPGALVYFDGVAGTTTWSGDTTLTAVVPAHSAAGRVDVMVVNPDGQSATLTGAFLYTAVVPPTVIAVKNSKAHSAGSSHGGTKVTITGTGFLPGAVVAFGGVPATGVVVVSGTDLTCITPAHAKGIVDVRVTNLDGGTGALAGAWTYSH